MVVGIASKTHTVLVALKVCDTSIACLGAWRLKTLLVQRNAEELSSYQKKIIGIDEHFGLALAGLASDARVLSNFMKRQALASKMTYGRPIPIERIVERIGDRAQTSTQVYTKRPYGVGLLVAGVVSGSKQPFCQLFPYLWTFPPFRATLTLHCFQDETGPHLFEFQPSGMTQEMVACAIGARSQMARTYLERHLDKFADSSRDELIKHGLLALKESLSQDKELTVDNASLGVTGVAKDGKRKIETFKLYDGPEIGPLLEAALETSEAAPAEEGGESMEVDT